MMFTVGGLQAQEVGNASQGLRIARAVCARQGLSEGERFLVADDVVQQLRQHGDPWALSQELPPATGRAHATPPTDKR